MQFKIDENLHTDTANLLRQHAVDDGVQTDHWLRHADQRGLRQAVLHDPGFQEGDGVVADPDFDGDPVQVYVPGPDDPPTPPDDAEDTETTPDPGGESDPPDVIGDPIPPGSGATPEPRKKYVVNDVPVWVIAERVQYYGKEGKLITESLKDYTRQTVLETFTSLDDFLSRWNAAEQKQAITGELEGQGVLLEALAEEVTTNSRTRREPSRTTRPSRSASRSSRRKRSGGASRTHAVGSRAARQASRLGRSPPPTSRLAATTWTSRTRTTPTAAPVTRTSCWPSWSGFAI